MRRVVAAGGDVGRWFLPAVVVLVVLGVLGMHSLVADVSMPETASVVGAEVGTSVPAVAPGPHAGPAVDASLVVAHAWGTPGAMGAMATMGCVAVLAAAALALLALVSRGIVAAPRRRVRARSPGGSRQSLPGAPSLLELSILRV